MLMGFIQSFTYAEIAGLFPNKSGGASVYGAAAWLRYGKFIAPLVGVVQLGGLDSGASLGSAIAAGYILNLMEPIAGCGARSPNTSRPQAAAGNVVDEAAATRGADADPQLDALHHSVRRVVSLSVQLDLLHRRDPDAAGLRHPASRHPGDGAACRPSSA